MTPPFFSGPTWLKQVGAWSVRLLTFGRHCRRAIFRIILLAPGVRRNPTNCWSATGAIGGTSRNDSGWRHRRHNARLALFDVQNGEFKLFKTFYFSQSALFRARSNRHRIRGIRLDCTRRTPASASPVLSLNGRVEASNLPWIIESRRLADELKINNAVLINDLEATGWGIGALSIPAILVALNNVIPISGNVMGNQAVIAAGTGLGEGGLYWDGRAAITFLLPRAAIVISLR